MENFFLYLRPFLLALLLSLVFMKAIIVFSRRYRLFDPVGGQKTHTGNISRLGGVGIIAAFWLSLFLSGSLVFEPVKIGLLLASLGILIFGAGDDLRHFSWKSQLIFQMLIGLLMIHSGLGVDYIANPFGGSEFRLDGNTWAGISVGGSLFILLWIVGFMNVVNWLDGMDGLAGGVVGVAGITLFFLAVSELVNQPPLGVMAIALVGALAGFLFYNSHPAKIFMGTSGSYFLGFLLAALAVFAGGKIATVFMVMGFPILDAFWVVVKRLSDGKSPFAGDRSHFQYNLLDRGWSERQVVLFICLLSAVFGLAALVFQGTDKFVALMLLFILALTVTNRAKVPQRRGVDKNVPLG